MPLRKKHLSEAFENTRVDLSPMIDCVFILLIFFIVTTVFVEESGLSVNRPDIPREPVIQTIPTVELIITETGKVLYHERSVGVEGIPELIRPILSNHPDTPVLIHAAEKSSHAVFAEVYGQVKQAGASQVSFR